VGEVCLCMLCNDAVFFIWEGMCGFLIHAKAGPCLKKGVTYFFARVISTLVPTGLSLSYKHLLCCTWSSATGSPCPRKSLTLPPIYQLAWGCTL
jgi:hypothetical protein